MTTDPTADQQAFRANQRLMAARDHCDTLVSGYPTAESVYDLLIDAFIAGAEFAESPNTFGPCRSCQQPADLDRIGRCDACDSNAAESATQQSQYAGAGLGWIDP